MQPLLDGPRSTLTDRIVRRLLQSDSAIQITYGADALDSDFGEVADISEYVGSGGSIKSDITASIQRTCSLNIDADVTDTGWSYLSGFVRPFMSLRDMATGDEAKFHLGVYTLTTPQRVLGTVPATLAFSGYDLIYLLKQPIGDSYEVASGSDPAQAAADAISAAVPGAVVYTTPSETTLSQQMSWPFDASQPTTYLEVIEKLLASIGYRGVWVDWDGNFRVEPFLDMQEAPFEWTFDLTAEANIISDARQQDIDLFDVANWFRFVMADLPDLPVEGQSQFTYEDASPSNPGSTMNRGRTIRHIESVTANSYDDLLDYAQRVIAATLAPGETFTVTSQPFPLAWHLDLIQYLDPALSPSLPTGAGGERRVVATTWTLPLDGMSDMTWTWQTITDQTVALGLAVTTDDDGSVD